ACDVVVAVSSESGVGVGQLGESEPGQLYSGRTRSAHTGGESRDQAATIFRHRESAAPLGAGGRRFSDEQRRSDQTRDGELSRTNRGSDQRRRGAISGCLAAAAHAP